MDGIAGVTVRVAQIESRIASFNPMTGGATTDPATTGAAFAATLAGAVSATDGRTTMASSGRLNAAGVPVELASYGNGKIPPGALDSVGATGHRLWSPAASSLESLLLAADRDGVRIGITDSYRSYDEQVDVARRKGLYSQGGLAAQPGTSDHGWGRSVDLDLDPKALTWMRANGARYGFVEDTPRESWHWTFTP